MIIFSIIQVGYLATFKPSEETLLMKLDVFNEYTTVFLADILLIFSPGNVFKIDLEGDCIFLGLLFGNLVVHLFFLIKSTVVDVKESCKKRRREGKGCCCCCRSENKKKVDNIEDKTHKEKLAERKEKRR